MDDDLIPSAHELRERIGGPRDVLTREDVTAFLRLIGGQLRKARSLPAAVGTRGTSVHIKTSYADIEPHIVKELAAKGLSITSAHGHKQLIIDYSEKEASSTDNNNNNKQQAK